MSFSALASTLGCDVTDPTQTNLDDPVERELTYALFGIMPFDNCHHEGVINAMSNDNIDSTELCMVYRLYAVNNGEIPKPYPTIDINLEAPFEDPAFRKWNDQIKSKLFCRNCWLHLLPKHLGECLQHILNHLNKHCSNPFEYSNDEESLVHLLFFIDMVRYPFVIRYVLNHKTLYRKAFDYYFKVLQLIYCNDIFFDKYRYVVILGQFSVNFYDHFFINSWIFWKTEHIHYLQQIGFKRIITKNVLNNLFMHRNQTYTSYSPPLAILSLITGYNYVSDVKLLHNENDKERFVRKMCILILGNKEYLERR
eukprot:130200_1